MKTNKYIKILFTISIILLLIFIVIYLVEKSTKKNYPSEPIKSVQLGKTDLKLDISGLKNFSNRDFNIYEINQEDNTSIVESMIQKVSLSLDKNNNKEVIYWEDNSNSFSYEMSTGILSFDLSKPLDISEGEDAFALFFQSYLQKDYNFIFSKTEISENGDIWYYASRVLNEVPIQLGRSKEYSDILIFNSNGKLKGGEVILTEFIKEKFVVPLISKDLLLTYIKLEEYPKESYVNFAVLNSVIDDTPYSFSSWIDDVLDKVSNCKSGDLDIIYLYQGMEQSNILPIYKVDATCEVEYEEEVYSVPAVYYINAIDPDYLSSQD